MRTRVLLTALLMVGTGDVTCEVADGTPNKAKGGAIDREGDGRHVLAGGKRCSLTPRPAKTLEVSTGG